MKKKKKRKGKNEKKSDPEMMFPRNRQNQLPIVSFVIKSLKGPSAG
jgi:hypothetical protein